MSDAKSDKCSKHPCRRPVNRDGMCGLHANAREKFERAKRQAAELKALGVDCYWTSNGEVVLSDPEKLIQELGSVGPDGRSR